MACSPEPLVLPALAALLPQSPCWPPAALARSTQTPPTLESPRATASPWPTGEARQLLNHGRRCSTGWSTCAWLPRATKTWSALRRIWTWVEHMCAPPPRAGVLLTTRHDIHAPPCPFCSAKAAVANMEFVQFHPTSLFGPATPAVAAGTAPAALAGGRSFLITEAVRGEGGMLYNLGEILSYGFLIMVIDLPPTPGC